MARKSWRNGTTRKSRGPSAKPRRPQPLTLEQLEDREVPAVVFQPVLGAETVSWLAGGNPPGQQGNALDFNGAPILNGPLPSSSNPTALSNPAVYLVFLGPDWIQNGKPIAAVNRMVGEAKTILSSTYFSGLKDYGGPGTPHFGDVAVDDDSVNHFVTTVPGGNPMFVETDYLLSQPRYASWQPPGPTALTSPIYCVVRDNGGNAGSHGFGPNHQTQGDPYTPLPIISADIALSSTSQFDQFGRVFSHEVAECLFSGVLQAVPGSGGLGGLGVVSPLAPGGYGECCDAEPDVNYYYRVQGVRVAPYWSVTAQATPGVPGAYLVPDGTAQTVVLNPIWTNNNTKFTGQYDLTLNLDQGAYFDHGVTIDGTPSGTTVTLSGFNVLTGLPDNESFAFDGGQIRNITIETGAGAHTINVQEVAADQTVTVEDAGVDAVTLGKNHSLAGILGNVSILNGAPQSNPHVALTLDDAADGARRILNQTQDARNLAFFAIADATGKLGTITYDSTALSSLSIDGGTAHNLFTFLVTAPYFTTTLDTGIGSDTVDVQRTGGPLVITSTAATAKPGQAQDTVHLGSVLFGPTSSVQNFFGSVSVSNRAGSTNLLVDDTDDPNALNWTVTASSLTNDYYLGAPAPIHYGVGVSSLTIHGGRGANTFLVQSTGPATTIDAGQGTTAVTVGDPNHSLNLVSGLTVHGNGKTTLTVDDRNTHDINTGDRSIHNNVAFNLQAADLTRTDRLGGVFPQPGDPTFTMDVQFNRASAVTVLGGASGSSFDVQGVADRTTVALFGGGGFNAATFDDSANANNLITTYDVTSSNVTRIGVDAVGGGRFQRHTASINYHGMQSLEIKGGTSGNDFQVFSTQIGTPTTLDAGPGPDTVEVGDVQHNLNNVFDLTINGAGNTTATVDDTGNKPMTTGAFFYTPLLTQFFVQAGNTQQPTGMLTRIELAQISSVGVQTVTFASTVTYQGLSGLAIDGGPAARNFYQIDSTAGRGASGVTVTAGGADAVTVGEAQNGVLDPITNVTVNGNGSTTLALNDPGATGREEYDVHSDHITCEPITSPPTSPTQTIAYSGLASIVLNGANSTSNLFQALGTPAGTTVSLNAGNGGFNQFLAFDEFSSADSLQGAVAFHGHQTSDFGERVDDHNIAGHTFTLSAIGPVSTVQRDGAADLTYDGLSQMIVAVPTVGGNRVNVQSVAPGVFMNITLANGDQAVVGSLAPVLGGTMEGILGNVGFTAETAGTATVTLVDTGDITGGGKRVTIAPPPSATDPFSSIVGMSGAPGLGVFFLLNPGSAVSVLGGAGDKTFALRGPLPGVTLRIDGGVGANTLDYSGWTGDVTVNLQRGTATGVDGGISNIRNVTGSIGNDLLVGDANANVLIGGTGRNVIIGGGGPDQITGGDADNLLIGGTTGYDQNADALDLVMKEWLSAGDFAARMAALRTGGDLLTGTGIQLDDTTVHPDGLSAVTPGPGNNWVIA
jgi:hypothetical protein